jgi:hypothetical protein
MSHPISRGGVSVESPRPSVSTRTEEFTPRELPLAEVVPPDHPVPHAVARTSGRIREALRRWFDEDL